MSAGEEGENLNAAYLAMQVFDKVNEQFVLNQMKKQDRKAAKIGQRQDFLEKFASNNQISKHNIIE